MCTMILYLGFMFFKCLVGYLSMTVWTPAVLSVLYAYVLYFCICPCSVQLSMFHMERRYRNTLIIIIIIIIIRIILLLLLLLLLLVVVVVVVVVSLLKATALHAPCVVLAPYGDICPYSGRWSRYSILYAVFACMQLSDDVFDIKCRIIIIID